MLSTMKEISGGNTNEEVAPSTSTQLARTAPLNKQIQHYRNINELDLRQTLWTGIPAGFALALAQTGEIAVGLLAIPLLIIALVSGVKLLRKRPKSIQAENTEFKAGDYTALQIWAPFLPAVGWLAAYPLNLLELDALQTPPLISGMFGGLLLGIGTSFGAWGIWTQSFRVGKRRIEKIVELESLDGVTQTRMEAIEVNGDILGALITAGAVDGNDLSVTTLGKLMDWEKDDIAALQERVTELEKLGLVKVSGKSLFRDAKHWKATVTPEAVRNIAQQGKR